ncbi:MAG: MFS transporter, partial [Bacteroidales bacterium]|nr:MFS transporter [Bacteroidales bacterium]
MNLKTTPFPFRVDKFPFFYGWVILIAGTIGVLASIPGQTMGVSVFTDYIIDALRIERTSLSLAYMLGTIASGLLITRAGRYYDKYGARVMAMGAGLMLGAFLLALSKVESIVSGFSHLFKGISYEVISIVVLIIGFFGLRFFGQGILTMVSRNMVMKWFEKRRGLANALMGVFVSFGFSYAPRLFNVMIDNSDWRRAWLEMG